MRGEKPIGPSLGGDDHGPFAELEGLLDRLGQPPALGGTGIGSGLEPIDDRLDLMLDLAVEREVVGQVDHLAVDPGPHVAGTGQIGEEVFIFPLLAADDRRQYQKRCPGRQFLQHPRHDLLAGLGGHGAAASRGNAPARPGHTAPANSR